MFKVARRGTAHDLWTAVLHYYERSSYIQQCTFVEGLVSRLDDFDSLDHYHRVFNEAAEGLDKVFETQTPRRIAEAMTFGLDAAATPMTQQELYNWVKELSETGDHRPAHFVRWAVSHLRQAHVRSITVPMYLRGIEQQYGHITSRIRALQVDPRDVLIDNIMSEVMEAAEQNRQQKAMAMKEQQRGGRNGRAGGERKRSNPRSTRSRSDKCKTCNTPHAGKRCWVEHPDEAPKKLQDQYKKRHDDWIETNRADDTMSTVSGPKSTSGALGYNLNVRELEDDGTVNKQCMFEYVDAPESESDMEYIDTPPSESDIEPAHHESAAEPKPAHHESAAEFKPANHESAAKLNIELAESTDAAQSLLATETALNCEHTLSWIVDSGASTHATGNEAEITDKVETLSPIITANGVVISRTRGTVVVTLRGVDGRLVRMKLHDTIHIPGLDAGLFSVRRALDGGLCFRPDLSALVDKAGKLVIQLVDHGRLWLLDEPGGKLHAATGQTAKPAVGPTAMAMVSPDIWHRRLGHPTRRYAEKTLGRELDTTPCEACAQSKAQRQPHHEELERPQDWFAHLTTDLCGPVTPLGLGNARYLAILTDRATGYRWLVTLRTKDEAKGKLRDLMLKIMAEYGRTIRSLTTDGSRELHVDLPGLTIRTSAPYTPEQNGMAEKGNHVVVRRARTMMLAANLPGRLWPEISRAAVHVGNRVYMAPIGKTPIQRVHELADSTPGDSKPDWAMTELVDSVDHLRVVGCRAYVLIPEERRTASRKFAPRAELGVMVGYEGRTNYLVMMPGMRIVITPHVTFNELELPFVPKVQLPDMEPQVDWGPPVLEPPDHQEEPLAKD